MVTWCQAGLDYEGVRTYNFFVAVIGELNKVVRVTVAVTNVNEAPQPPALTNVSIPESSRVGFVVVAFIPSNDPDGGAMLYTYDEGGGDPMFALGNTTGSVTVAGALDYEALLPTRKFYELTVVVSDGALSALCSVLVYITNVNEPPVAVSSLTMSVAENTVRGTVLPNPVVAFDEDGDDVFFSIVGGNSAGYFGLTPSVAAGGSGRLDRTSVRVELDGLDYEALGGIAYRFNLTVQLTDVGGASINASVVVTVADQNEPPQTVSSVALTVAENATVGFVIGRLAATDPDAGNELSWLVEPGGWGAGAEAALLLDGGGAVSVRRTLDFESQPSFMVVARVSDGRLFASSTVTVTVTDVNEQPVLDSGAYFASVPENALAPAALLITDKPAKMCATDVDALSTFTFSVSGAVAAQVEVNQSVSCTGVVTLRPLDFESMTVPVSGTLTVCDNGVPQLCSNATLVLQVTDVNEPPVLASFQFRVSENALAGASVGTVTVTDPDAGDSMAFQLVGDAAIFDITRTSNTTALLRLTAAPRSVVSTPWYLLNVSVVDAGGFAAWAPINVTIVPENDPPVVVSASLNVQENAALTTVVGSLAWSDRENNPVTWRIAGGRDSWRFTIDASSGVVRVAAAIDFESMSQFVLDIEARDMPAVASNSLVGSAVMTINVVDVNERPTFGVQEARTVFEDAVVGFAVGDGLVAEDVDSGDALTFTLVTVEPRFAVSTSGILTVAAPLDFETRASYLLLVRVSDRAGLTAFANVSVTVLDVNEAPRFPGATLSITENVAAGTPVGTSLDRVTVDEDSRALESLRYDVVSGDVTLFGVDPLTGQLFTLTSLDYEEARVRTVVVRVTDRAGAGLSVQGTVTVQIVDVNDVTVTGFEGAVPHATVGDEAVVIVGSNLGPRSAAVATTFNVTYGGATGTMYQAVGCARLSSGLGNTRVQCRTSPGSGAALRWRVVVQAEGAAEAVVLSADDVVTSYLPPTVTWLSSSTRGMRTQVPCCSRACMRASVCPFSSGCRRSALLLSGMIAACQPSPHPFLLLLHCAAGRRGRAAAGLELRAAHLAADGDVHVTHAHVHCAAVRLRDGVWRRRELAAAAGELQDRRRRRLQRVVDRHSVGPGQRPREQRLELRAAGRALRRAVGGDVLDAR